MLQTRVGYYTAFITHQSYQREILPWSWNKAYLTINISWDTASCYAWNSCEKRYSLCLLAASDYKFVFQYSHLPDGA